jgi:hypothetical protein
MIIKDANGKYELKVDQARGIVYESFDGLLKGEDINNLHNDYVNKIYPLIKGKKWVKVSDMTGYKTSNIVDESDTHLAWCVANGMVPGAIIVESAIVKMQMNRASKNSDSAPTAFTTVAEADSWLKTKGF